MITPIIIVISILRTAFNTRVVSFARLLSIKQAYRQLLKPLFFFAVIHMNYFVQQQNILSVETIMQNGVVLTEKKLDF